MNEPRKGRGKKTNNTEEALIAPSQSHTQTHQWEWGNQDSFPGNVGTVLGHGGGDGWYRVQWESSTHHLAVWY